MASHTNVYNGVSREGGRRLNMRYANSVLLIVGDVLWNPKKVGSPFGGK